jgi:hypothetical protein
MASSHAAATVNLEAQHKDAITKLEAQHKDAITKLETENAALKARVGSMLNATFAAVKTGGMVLPVRPETRVDGITQLPPAAEPVLMQFDRAWCAAMGVVGWKTDIDAAAGDVHAAVTHGGSAYLTLRSAAPLPRLGPGGQLLPTYRIIVEAYDAGWSCHLGFVPSHRMRSSGTVTAVVPTPKYGIDNYGGWHIMVRAWSVGEVHGDARYAGWTVVPPGDSAYATTGEVPAVAPGGAVEFAVDYAAGTCRVAFNTAARVAGGFVEEPAKMELRFVATAAVSSNPCPRARCLGAHDCRFGRDAVSGCASCLL